MEFFSQAIEKFTAHLLASVCTDYNLDLEELKTRYIGVKAIKVTKPKVPKVPMEDRPVCTGTSGKKKIPCKNKCKPGGDACHLHCEKLPVEVCQPCLPQVPTEVPKAAQALADIAARLAEALAPAMASVPVKKVRKPKPKAQALPQPPPPPPLVVLVTEELETEKPKKVVPKPKAPVPELEEEPEEPLEVLEPEELDMNARLQLILQSGATFESDDEDEEDEEDEEPASPGAQRHKGIIEAKGKSWADYYDEDCDEEEELEEELED